jgi:endonuclease YncB( thermonuclease family)
MRRSGTDPRLSRMLATLSVRSFVLMLAVFSASEGRATGASVGDGGTLEVAGVTYRLDGIDAPELDQMCIDEHADTWACGIEARDQLAGMIGGRQVGCEDLGADAASRKRHIGICTLEGETVSLNQLLVRQGFALNSNSTAKGRFGDDETAAKDNRRGLWKGCFVAPREFRRGRKDGALLGDSCRADKDREIRAALDPAMPSGCSIKGKLAARARVTGNVGVYHLQGCRSYPALTKPDRWFCTEEDAQAEGFRKAYNCGATGRGRM